MRHHIKKRRDRQQMIRMFIAVAALIVLAAILLFSNRVIANETRPQPYYRTITVEKRDSLWSIAEEYAPASDNKSLSAYVEDLRSINSLRRDAPLQVGQPLLVVYYADTAQQ